MAVRDDSSAARAAGVRVKNEPGKAAVGSRQQPLAPPAEGHMKGC
jgi:hypothetical protein